MRESYNPSLIAAAAVFRIRYFLLLLLLLIQSGLFSQTAPDKYWVKFSDKENSPFSISNPGEFLSEQAVLRREKYAIHTDWYDLPVNESYINQLLALGNCSVENKSKWFNSVTIKTADSTLIDLIDDLPFVMEVRSVHTYKQPNKEVSFYERSSDLGAMNSGVLRFKSDSDEKKYGPGFRQVEIMNGHLLHELGYTGSGMHIAILDAGWTRTDSLPAFDHIRNDQRFEMFRDFVDGDNHVFGHSTHGTYVLSLMAAIIPDSLCGTATDAHYYLFRTEEAASEFLVEEDNWVAAIEVCDSLGIDIINSSLGYSMFDDSLMNHTYNDMDGNTTRISIAADMAASKGILVVNSAGNEGDDPWHYITAPSDGDSVLCIGAVDAAGIHAFFSSFGPSAAGDIKPNVSAMGFDCVIADLDSTIRRGNGTSFSSPLLAGMAACLWQSNRDKNNMEIFKAIEKSASLYPMHNDSLGYGIPDFFEAFQLISRVLDSGNELQLQVRPNPFSDIIHIASLFDNECDVTLQLFDVSGRLVMEQIGINGNAQLAGGWLELSWLNPGVYYLKLSSPEGSTGIKILKLGE